MTAKTEGAVSRLPIKTISSREVYRNHWTRVREDVIERADGQRGFYGVVDKDPACLIIPLETTPEGEFLTLVEQFRYTVGGRFMELPQGGWEQADVVPKEMARGELAEELTLGARDLDPEEADLVVHRVRVAEFEAMLLDGTIVDNCSAAAWGIYRLWRESHPRQE